MNRLFFLIVSCSILLLAEAGIANAGCNPREGCYGALAAGDWRDSRGGAYNSVGSAVNYPSKQSAIQAALGECRSGGGRNCKVIGTFSFGACGYITSGKKSGRGVRWTSGSDQSEVYGRCTRGGYSCDWPIGGCTGTP